MLTSLDHGVLLCRNIGDGVKAYETLLGIAPIWRARDNDAGIETALFSVANTAIELLAPIKGGAAEARVLQLLDGKEGKLTSLAFVAADIEAAHNTLTRRGLKPSLISNGESENLSTGLKRSWRRFRCDDEACAGIKTFILQPDAPLAATPATSGTATSLDHLVINTPNPERAVATYGARLGLRFALDRTAEQWKTRFLFFRLGGLTLEVIHRLGEPHDGAANDTIWGLTWETDDLIAARTRLEAAGLDVSEIRTGRKPGSEVFTVRNGTQDVPTLFIAHAAR